MSRVDHVRRGLDPEPRRLKQVFVDPRLLGNALIHGRASISLAGLPDGAECVNVAFDFFAHAVVFTVEHPDFPPVPLGKNPPMLDVRYTILDPDDE